MQDNTNNNPFNINQAFLEVMSREQQVHQSSKMRGEVGSLFRDDSIKSFFNRLREEVIDSWEPDPAPDSIVVSEAEKTLKMAQELDIVDAQEVRFNTWRKSEDCPLAKLETFLKVTKRKEGTKKLFMHAAQRYYKFNKFAPQFTDKELYDYLVELDVSGLAPRSVKQHRIALKRWWRVLDLKWPLEGIVINDDAQEDMPPTFSKEQIARLISLVKEMGTPEQKFYFTLSTIYGCRAGELGSVTAANFLWDGNGGILSLQTLKRGKKRVHSIPEGLTPFLKEYSYVAKPSSNTVMGEKFHRWCRQLGFPIPKMPLKTHVDMNGKKIHVKGYGWHAIRHSIVTELVETHVSEIYISQWMGWKSQQSMVRRYAVLDALKVDKEVQEKHPFLPLWTSW